MFEEARLTPRVLSLKDDLVGDIKRVIWVLMGTIGLVLLVACANVANLLLVRAESRQQELAVRAALGAGTKGIARELLVESVALALAGGAVGLALAFGALRLLLALAPGNLPRIEDIGLDITALAFTLVVSVLSGLVFGSIPVLKYARTQPGVMLRGGSRTASASKSRHRARNMLVVAQVAVALVLLVSSGLMIRTFQALRDVQPGFAQAQEVQTVRLSIPDSQMKDPEAVVRMHQAIAERMAAVAGVSSVALASTVTMSGDGWHDPVFAADRTYSDSQVPPIRLFKFVSPGYVQTMGASMVAGRDFTWSDTYGLHPVVMVSETLARELWSEPSNAIGKRVRPYPMGPWREVVGVVSDMRDDGLNQKPTATAYWPLMLAEFSPLPADAGQNFVQRGATYLVRSSRTGSSGFVDGARQGRLVDQRQPAAGQGPYAAGRLRCVARADLVHAGDAGHRRRHGAAARRRRDLRRDVVLGVAAHARDRDPRRARRAGANGDADVRVARPDARGHRRRDRTGRRAWHHAADVVAALRGQPGRSDDLRDRVADVDGRRRARQLRAGVARGSGRSSRGAESGVATLQLRMWNLQLKIEFRIFNCKL